MGVGSWELEAGSWELEVGSWKLQAYNVARASIGEVRSLTYVIEDNYEAYSEQAVGLRDQANRTGRLLSGLIASTRARRSTD